MLVPNDTAPLTVASKPIEYSQCHANLDSITDHYKQPRTVFIIWKTASHNLLKFFHEVAFLQVDSHQKHLFHRQSSQNIEKHSR
jgi:hypothetical protein